MVRALGCVSCDITHETGVTACDWHWVLRLVISHTRQRVRFVTGTGFCGRSASCDITHETGGYEFLRILGSASCDITHETGVAICYGHWSLRLVNSHTKQGVRVVTGMLGFVVL